MKQIFILSFTLVFFSCHTSKNSIDYQVEQPNILFIEVDDLTAKYLKVFGAEFSSTPNIDRLGAEGVVFENAVCQGAMCGPSRNSLITALYPHNLGFYANKQIQSLPKDVWTFPKALQASGYETFWVGKCHIKPNTKGIKAENRTAKKDKAMKEQMGFDHVFQSAGRTVALRTARKAQKSSEWEYGLDAYADYLYNNGLIDTFLKEKGDSPTTLDGDNEYMDGFFTSMTIDQLESYDGEKPFFMWTNFSCPHGPFDVPQSYHDQVNSVTIPEPILEEDETFQVPSALKPHKSRMNAKQTKEYRAAYTATIEYVDEQFGRIFNFIKNSRYSKNTVIVFFSDHGIMTGDHGLKHKSTLFKEVLNPSLIIWAPSHSKQKRVAEPVELLDLATTVLDLAKAGKESLGACPNGNSLMPLLSGNGRYTGHGFVFSEIEGYRSVFDGRYKYIENDGDAILFDLEKNPDETINFASELPNIVKSMKRIHDEWIERSGPILEPLQKVY